MTNLEQVKAELSDSAATESTTQTTTSPTPEATNVDTGAAQSDDSVADKGEPEQKAKKDLSGLSKQDKAEYAFRRQLSKQRDKYDADLKARDASIEDLRKQIAALQAAKEAKPAEVKYRKDFASDEEYLQWYMDQAIDKRFAGRDADHAKAKAEQEEAQRKQQELDNDRTESINLFKDNIARAIPEADRQEFGRSLRIALDNGLGAVLDNSPLVKNYVLRNPDGPRLLNRMLTDRNSFMRVFGQGDPTEALLEAHDIVRDLRNSESAQVDTVQTDKPRGVPAIGKPGAGGSSSAPSMFNDDKALIDFLRKPRRR